MAWYINNDLERIIAYNQAIVGTNTIDTVYVPSSPQEGDNAPYPLLSGAQTTTAVAKVNGIFFGRFHTVSYSSYAPKTLPLAHFKDLTAIKKPVKELDVLDKDKMEKVLDECEDHWPDGRSESGNSQLDQKQTSPSASGLAKKRTR